MGGTAGEQPGASTNPALSPTGFAGSRAAVSNAAAPSWAGLMSETSPAVTPAAATPTSGSPLAVNPVNPTVAPTVVGTPAPGAAGFTSTPYSTPGALPHIGAPDSVVAPAEAPKEFAAPTSFRPIYEATAEASEKLGGKGLFYSDRNWTSNPEAVRQWLQAIADAGGDWRKTDQYYNPVSAGSGMTIYWPGDPARPK